MFAPMLYEITFLITLFLIYIIIYLKKSFLYWETRGIPFLSPSIPFGNVQELFMGKTSLGVTVADIYKKFKEQGADYGGFYIFAKPLFIPISPELIGCILVKDFNYFVERGTHYDEKVDPLSAHLFSVRNPKWHELRTKFTPMFTTAKLKGMFPIFINISAKLKDVLEELSKIGGRVDIKDILARFTTDIISSCAFGLECNSLKNQDAQLKTAGDEFSKGSFRNSIVFSLGLVAPKLLNVLKIPLCPPNVSKYFIDVIRYTVENREMYHIERNDVLDLLIKLKNNNNTDVSTKFNGFSISFNDLAAQSFIFFMAGYETSSSTMTFAIFELSQNEEIQNKLREEITNTLEKYNDEITYDSLNEMTYLDKIVQETLRKYPVVPVLNRECIKDYKIPGTDKIIEKGTSIFISTFGLHTDPGLYEDPEVFDPERFSSKRKYGINTNTYLPFGLGPRNCIGTRFGLMQTKIGLTVLLKNFSFKLYPEENIPQKINNKSFVMAFEETIWLQVSRI